MKKLATLLLAAGLVFSAATGAGAVDFKAKGQWIMSFDYGDNSTFMKETARGKEDKRAGYGKRGGGSVDNFSAQQRVRLQLDAVASESLSGTVFFEIGDQLWGKAVDGGALGADGKVVEVKNAYIDWMVPNTDLKVRMGIQGVALPAFTTGGSQVFAEDVAGVVLSNKFTDNVTLTAMWLRPFNDNFVNDVKDDEVDDAPGLLDNMDLFGLLLPLSFDGVKVTPWGMIGYVGQNTFREGRWTNGNYYNNLKDAAGGNSVSIRQGLMPAAAALKSNKYYGSNSFTPFWLGQTGEVTMWDPFRLAWDMNYGNNGASYQELRKEGWYASLLAEYKLDWGTPGLYGWYSSGDDNNVKNGSEQMPTLRANSNNQFSNYAFNGNPYIAREGVVGLDMMGTWGIGARVKDMSFLEGLKHTFRVNYFGGTNAPGMAKYVLGREGVVGRTSNRGVTDFNTAQDLYLTTRDSAMEVGLTNTYKIYDNLTMVMDAAYVALWLDQSRSVWGNNGKGSRGISERDAWNVNLSFVYDF